MTTDRDSGEHRLLLPETQTRPSPAELLRTLRELREHVASQGRRTFERWAPRLHRRTFRPSALNLAHYLALRTRDLRPVQTALMPYGLSSLGRLEARVLPNLDAVTAALGVLAGADGDGEARGRLPAFPTPRAFFRGERLLRRNTLELFGGPRGHARQVGIMVTLDGTSADDYEGVRRLVALGTDVVRLNCAHDGPDAWAAVIGHVRRAGHETGLAARVLMDLGGPKCRAADVLCPPDRARIADGDRLLLVAGGGGFAPPVAHPFQASCTIPQAVARLAPGATVWFDDGRFRAAVEEVVPAGAVLRVSHAGPKGAKLKGGKGLNFPGVDLGVPPLSDRDLADLDFVAAHADAVGYSYVQRASDVRLLQRELAARRPDDWTRFGLIAKVETAAAIRSLPEITVQAAGRQPFGVMIARGDLALEIGFERLAEMQEELLWLCEAAHVPVVWATEVLERLRKRGSSSRGEMTDAVMAGRAECVMLNKGPYVGDAVALLDRLLARMAEHQHKKTHRLRALRAWAAEA